MKINMNNEIGEKDTKQVISSFKRLVRYILYNFSQDLLDKKDKSLEITFDNNEQFYVGIAFTDNKDEINDVGLEQRLKDEDIGEINIDNVNDEIQLE